MANLNVAYQEMRDAATRLTTGQDEITTKLNELKGFIESLISSGFVTDQASVAFGESYRQFTQGAMRGRLVAADRLRNIGETHGAVLLLRQRLEHADGPAKTR